MLWLEIIWNLWWSFLGTKVQQVSKESNSFQSSCHSVSLCKFSLQMAQPVVNSWNPTLRRILSSRPPGLHCQTLSQKPNKWKNSDVSTWLSYY
jgi:hypothetical protein